MLKFPGVHCQEKDGKVNVECTKYNNKLSQLVFGGNLPA